MSASPERRCGRVHQVTGYVLDALPSDEIPSVEAHIARCPDCREELRKLPPVMESLAALTSDVMLPPPSLRNRLTRRIAGETGECVVPDEDPWLEPDWEDVAPGISCKLLATDAERQRVSMLVRLAPGVEYPPHTHAGVEDLHLLHGELWIDDRKLCPGDYNRAQPATTDRRVWSETGCTCVLVTSTRDVLR